MPLYIARLPDYPDSLQKRLSVRQGHLERANKDKENGTSVFGRAFLSPNGSSSSSTDSSDSKAPNPRMAGSVMIFRLPTLEAVWERVKDDAYWTAGVWDRENATVDELLGDPTDEHAQFKA